MKCIKRYLVQQRKQSAMMYFATISFSVRKNYALTLRQRDYAGGYETATKIKNDTNALYGIENYRFTDQPFLVKVYNL